MGSKKLAGAKTDIISERNRIYLQDENRSLLSIRRT